ncbi:hypothetical protein BC936DRAFT_138429 [Jimgerdemannia flammicorona]|uniref:LUD domain-containing protein n=1 Tax=Jimgerdemannia flammicorona TaxID=994334 RepID=A0A433CH90_9FUNG|nr:hypothetical protein BC936DRAFT_138429 [Jimgerdemannia flammicorona]
MSPVTFVNPKANETYEALLATTEELQRTDKRFAQLADDKQIGKTKGALEKKLHKVTVVENREAALELIKTLIPKGASVNNSHSTSLEEIGFVEYLKTATEWNNIHAEILKETDFAKSMALRRGAGTVTLPPPITPATTQHPTYLNPSHPSPTQAPQLITSSPPPRQYLRRAT